MRLALRHVVRKHSLANRGQSLVEFALILPVLLLIVLGTIDLGRAYFTAINMENAAKEGAFFGARKPQCPTDSGTACTDPQNVEWRVTEELDGIVPSGFEAKCFAPGTTSFSGPGKSLADCLDGDLYYVGVQAPFQLVTPMISALLGNSLNLSSAASAVVLTSFTSSGEVAIPTATATASTGAGNCMVPDFTNGTTIGNADDVWQDNAGFTTTPETHGPNGQQITWQSLPFGFMGPCNSTQIAVSNAPVTTPTPTPSPTPTPTPNPSATATATGSAAATPTPVPTPSPCTVPQLVKSPRITVTQAQGVWVAAGFSAANFSATRGDGDDYRVWSQTVAAGSVLPCLTSTIVVDSR